MIAGSAYATSSYAGSVYTVVASDDPTRRGLGLILATAATTHVTPPVVPLPTPGGVTPPVEHITTPTVPAPVLLDGRPQ